MNVRKAVLATENGLVFEGRAVGADGEATGELVFNTSMTGYQEILTDPSYAGQIVTMTYTQIGNYGVNPEDVESRKPFVQGFVMRECCFEPSNWRAKQSLPDYLTEHGIVAIDGVDTREITKMLRTEGAKKAVISTIDFDHDSLIQKAIDSPDMAGSDYVKAVSVTEPYEWNPEFEGKYYVVAFDYGIKYNILRLLERAGCRVTVLPATAPAEEVLKRNPDGVFLSNGPGDPAALPYIYPVVKVLFGKVPIFGICLGHQILGHAFGGTTFKLKFGHRGANQPVLNQDTGKVEITSQNHGFTVDPDSLDPSVARVTHINLNDKTVEGIEHVELPIFGVQYHPEASPGPHDSRYLFSRFVSMMENHRTRR
ncbi:MAG TPA: glutamine-hydrolyzing carbamoyl-phosphate synthase small subunit [Candidatus Hydrogenedentes bacterium]|nr:glutamine-hydrolyzing carbamoyl-phosphate synthase small subunit [Candidatus Hydrogenedentota bacterium]HOL76152.1 glutamine-hydrolyzing carbamoyl-phosphate synthase small subunit [Candidatus Hydrogenedentota bacterium]HPO84767.1 glutamine-hydrolyzing carbamoyl-phosphate synthase small subunit [Candidatus Hydrogenedentota bacterium]